MKKILLVAAVAGMAMVSCKKTYTCECTTTSKVYINGQTTSSNATAAADSNEKMKKKDAKDWCEKNNGTTTSGNTTNGSEVTIDCKLK